MKSFKVIIFFSLLFLGTTVVSPYQGYVFAEGSGTSSGYFTNIEKIPGSEPTNSLVAYIESIYKFGIGIAAILAVFMIAMGGFMYVVTSAGNAGKMMDAKDMVFNAVYGLILAMVAYLVLFVVNPDLLEGTLTGSNTVEDLLGSGSGAGGSGMGTGAGNGKCEPVPTGPCSVESLKATCFGSNAEKASGICNVESKGNELAKSSSDKCRNDSQKRSFSIGLFQINLTVNDVNSLHCDTLAFEGDNYNCSIKNETLYNQCVSTAQTGGMNIQKACQLSKNGSNWGAWGKCGGSWGSNSKCCY